MKKRLCNVSLTLTGNVTGLSGDVNGLSGDMTGLSGSVSDIYGNIAGLSGNMAGLSGNVTGLSGDVNGLYGNATDLEGNIDNCQLTEGEAIDEYYAKWVAIEQNPAKEMEVFLIENLDDTDGVSQHLKECNGEAA